MLLCMAERQGEKMTGSSSSSSERGGGKTTTRQAVALQQRVIRDSAAACSSHRARHRLSNRSVASRHSPVAAVVLGAHQAITFLA